MRGHSTLPIGPTHTEPTAATAITADAGHLLQMADASATSSRLTAGVNVSALVLGSAPRIGLYTYQTVWLRLISATHSCVAVST